MHKVWISGRSQSCFFFLFVFFVIFVKNLIFNMDLLLHIMRWVKSNDIFFWNDPLADNNKTKAFKLLHGNGLSREHFDTKVRSVAHKLGYKLCTNTTCFLKKCQKKPYFSSLWWCHLCLFLIFTITVRSDGKYDYFHLIWLIFWSSYAVFSLINYI